MFSATMPSFAIEMAEKYMKKDKVVVNLIEAGLKMTSLTVN